MISFNLVCNEGGEERRRFLYPLKPLPEEIFFVYDKLRSARRSYGGKFGEEMLSSLLLLSQYIYRIDDVGIVIVLPTGIPGEAQCHMAFWDGRMRGREKLCIELASRLSPLYHTLWAKIPLEALTVRAFAKRIGFKAYELDSTQETLCLPLQ